MEVLLCVFWKLLEEESKECIDVLACCNGVADRATTIRVANVDWLIKEDNRSVCVPGVWIVVKLQFRVNGRRAKFKEETSE